MFKLPAIGQKVKGQNLNRKSLQQIADEQAALDAKQTGQPQSSPSKPAVAHAKQESPPLPGADASEAAVAAAEKKSKPESSEEKSTPRMESNSSSKLYEVIYQKFKIRESNFLNLRTSTNELRLAVVIPAAINARLTSASFKPQLITRKPTNTKIATKTQVSKGIPTYFLSSVLINYCIKSPVLIIARQIYSIRDYACSS